MIIIDAFSSSYLSEKHTPFIYSVASKGFSTQIEPLFAFRGIEATIFTGVWPEAHGIWTEFSLRKNYKVCTFNNNVLLELIRMADAIPHHKLKLGIRYLLQKYTKNSLNFAFNLIPADAFRYFELSQKRSIFEERALGEIPTIFDIFRSKEIQYIYMTFQGFKTDKEIVKATIQMLRSSRKFDFLYMKLNELDWIGHKFGPDSLAIKKCLKRTDLNVRRVINAVQRIDKNANFLILSDHGMSKVNRAINIMSILGKLKAKIYKDYAVFLDSTMARFWFFNSQAREEIHNAMTNISVGHILSEEEKCKLRLPLSRKYGEMIYAVDEGCIVHPDFFYTTQAPNGMHGYAHTKTFEGIPMLIANKKVIQSYSFNKLLRFVDISPIVLTLLDLRAPDGTGNFFQIAV